MENKVKKPKCRVEYWQEGQKYVYTFGSKGQAKRFVDDKLGKGREMANQIVYQEVGEKE